MINRYGCNITVQCEAEDCTHESVKIASVTTLDNLDTDIYWYCKIHIKEEIEMEECGTTRLTVRSFPDCDNCCHNISGL